MMETVLKSIEYGGYRLTTIRRVITATPDDVGQVRCRITRFAGGGEQIIDEAMSEQEARAKVDARIARGE